MSSFSLVGGRDCYLTKQDRNKELRRLKQKKKIKGLPLSRAAPYDVEKAKYYADRRIKRLPNYMKQGLTEAQLYALVSNLKKIKERYDMMERGYVRKEDLEKRVIRRIARGKK